MKTTLFVALVLLLAPGCKREEPTSSGTPAPSATTTQPTPAPAPATPVTGDDVKKELTEAAQTTGQYVDQKKEEWITAAKAKLAELETKAAELKTIAAEKGAQWSAEAKASWESAMAELDASKATAKTKLVELTAASGPILQKASEEFTAAADKASGLWSQLKAKVSSMTAPQPATQPAPAPQTPSEPDK